jgi:hypothetical protein
MSLSPLQAAVYAALSEYQSATLDRLRSHPSLRWLPTRNLRSCLVSLVEKQLASVDTTSADNPQFTAIQHAQSAGGNR